MKIVVGSKNPIKIATTREAFEAVFPDEVLICEGLSVDSGVSDQPFGDIETKQGAYNRTEAGKKVIPGADYWVGLEGGILQEDSAMWASAWVCIQGKDGRVGYGRIGAFELPSALADLIQGGYEMGAAADILFEQENSKQKSATIGLLTNDALTRKDFYVQGVIYALIPFLNKELY